MFSGFYRDSIWEENFKDIWMCLWIVHDCDKKAPNKMIFKTKEHASKDSAYESNVCHQFPSAPPPQKNWLQMEGWLFRGCICGERSMHCIQIARFSLPLAFFFLAVKNKLSWRFHIESGRSQWKFIHGLEGVWTKVRFWLFLHNELALLMEIKSFYTSFWAVNTHSPYSQTEDLTMHWGISPFIKCQRHDSFIKRTKCSKSRQLF